MILTPSPLEYVARAHADLRLGLPVVIGDTLICSVETVMQDRFAELRSQFDDLCVAITHYRAATLKAHAYDSGMARLEIPSDVGLDWLSGVADPSLDLQSPLKGPFRSRRDAKAGHAMLGLQLLKAAALLPSALTATVATGTKFSGITRLEPDVLRRVLDTPAVLHRIASAKVPLRLAENTKLHIFRPEMGGEEHYAVEIGSPDRSAPLLTRLHSACFTGDLLGSLKCDCGAQLNSALAQMHDHGSGVLLYLNQEGRGIGLANKMRAYSLQDQGFDTVDANHRLGFDDDERDFRIGSGILKQMGFSKIRLMTNNPAKLKRMSADGLEVIDRVSLKVGLTKQNEAYLATKAAKSGHLL